ncbi:MAG TPA: MFS transporter, partial [Thermoanaerobaculia bacterium]|nr:MFS transporter [Thermoanaerobaculia bacterium]
FAQGSRGVSATAAGSFLTPLMLSWVTASVVGGRMLIRLGWRPLVVSGLLLLILGFGGLSAATRQTPTLLLVAELSLIGVGLGFTMLTLLIAVQHAVPRHQLGTATSLNQFFRSIGGAMGVALLGALLTSGLTENLRREARGPSPSLSLEQATALAANPSALVSREAQLRVAPEALDALQESLARSVRSVFVASGIACAIALLFALMLPRGRPITAEEEGRKLVMAEMTVIDPEHEPQAET